MLNKILVLFLLSASTFELNAQNICSDLKVLEATKQHWVSGAPGGRAGIKYSVKIIVSKLKGKLNFEAFFLEGEEKAFSVELYKLQTTEITKGDTVLITYNRVNNEPEEKAKQVPITKKWVGKTLIVYKIGGKQKYLAVPEFKEVPTLRGI